MQEELERRLEAVRETMRRRGIDHLLVGPSTDLVYLSGFAVAPSERLTMLIVAQEGTPRLVMPDFELPAVAELPPVFEPVPWSDGDDAAAPVAKLLPGGAPLVAVSGQTHARVRFALEAAAPRARWTDGDAVLAPARMRKSPCEIGALRQASCVADAVLGEIAGWDVVGMTERELVDAIRARLTDHGNDATGSGLAAFGANTAAPHHVPGDRRATAGDAVIVDFGGRHRHYRADVTRTFHMQRQPSAELRRAYEAVREANELAFERVRPGVPAEAIDAAAREHLVRAGYGERFVHRTGHGIGLDVHEPPYIVAGNETRLEEGMAFTIEPGVYVAGAFGVRIEDVVLVTATGAERLNAHPRELTILG